jgi:hypothetical protein
MPLLDKALSQRRPGELVFGLAILEKTRYKEITRVISAIQDPRQARAAGRTRSLTLQLWSSTASKQEQQQGEWRGLEDS